MSEWTNRDDRQRDAKAQYEHIMTTPAPPAVGAYIEAGVIGFVFGEMWRRGVLTPRDRRWITLACVGAADAPVPMETHTYAALNSGDVTNEEIDEFLLFFGTQMGWPKGSAMNTHIMAAMAKIADERGEEMQLPRFVPWADPADDDVRRARGEQAYADVHGVAPAPAGTTFRGRRVPRLPLRRGVDARRVPHPPRPATGQHLLQRRARRRRGDHRAPRGRAAQRRAQLRGAPGGRHPRSRCTWGGSWPAGSTTCSWPRPRAPESSHEVPSVTHAEYTYKPANLTPITMADGRSEATWVPSAEWGNPVGNVHGGYTAVLIDDVAGMALLSLIGSGAPTVSLQVDYLNAMPMGRTYTARGEVIRAGKVTAIVDVHVYDPDELLVARGKCYFQLPSSWRERGQAAPVLGTQ